MCFLRQIFCAVFLTISLFTIQIQAKEDLAHSHLSHNKKFKIGIVYSSWTKFDQSFSESAYRGLQAFLDRHPNASAKEFELKMPSQGVQYLTKLAQANTDIILAIGFNHAQNVLKVAAQFPNVRFVLIDGVADLPNVRSVLFREHEGSFLVGALAARKTKTHKIGFIGGMDIPLVRRFECAYGQGAHYVDPKIKTVMNMAGTTGAAWNDPVKGHELATSQIERGVDVIYTAAGKTSFGVFKKMSEVGGLAIAADSNQNAMHPGVILTSMVKGIDRAVYQNLEEAYNGTWKPGIQSLGIKEKAIGWSLDAHNRPLITGEDELFLDALANKIIKGEIQVIDYMTHNKCQLEKL